MNDNNNVTLYQEDDVVYGKEGWHYVTWLRSTHAFNYKRKLVSFSMALNE